MIIKEFMDMRIYCGGFEWTGDINEGTLRFGSEAVESTTFSSACRSRMPGRFSVELEWKTYSIRPLQPRTLEEVPVTLVDPQDGRAYFFEADTVRLTEAGGNGAMTWYDMRAEGTQPVIVGFLNKIPQRNNGQVLHVAHHDLREGRSDYQTLQTWSDFPIRDITALGLRTENKGA